MYNNGTKYFHYSHFLESLQGTTNNNHKLIKHNSPVCCNISLESDDYSYSSQSDSLDDNDSSDCDSISILTDTIDEEEECFTVSLSSSSSYSGLTISPRIGTICITDDDRKLFHKY